MKWSFKSIVGCGLMYAAPFIAMILPTVIHDYNTPGIVDLGIGLIFLFWCSGMTNQKTEELLIEVNNLKQEIEKLKNETTNSDKED